MCLPMSTVHHTHSEKGSVIAQFEQYRDLPSKSFENSSGLTFLDYCALSLSLSLTVASLLYSCLPSPSFFMLGYQWASRMRTRR